MHRGDAFLSRDSRNNARCMQTMSLVKKPDVLRPGTVGIRGSMVINDYGDE